MNISIVRRFDRFELSPALWSVLVCLAAAAVYVHTLGHGFVFDDGAEVVENTHIRSLASLPLIFRSTAWSGANLETAVYRPLTTVTYALNYAGGGLTPWSYHLINLLLHSFVTLMLFRLGLRLRLAPAAAGAAAMLFAVHPIHVEVVANVAGRKEALMAGFVLVTLFAHHRALARGGFWLGAASLAYAAAMFSKETGVVALGLVVLQDWFIHRQRGMAVGGRRQSPLYFVYGLTMLAYLIVRWNAVGGFGIAQIPLMDNPAAHASTLVRLMTATAVVGRGFGLLFAPAQLSPDYSYRAIPLTESPADPYFLLTALALILVTVAVVTLRQKMPLALFAPLWYALALLPAANLLLPIGTIFGERLLYLPSMAFFLFAGFLIDRICTRLKSSIISMIVGFIVLLLGARTLTYASLWVDNLTLFAAAAQVYPNSAKIHHKLGEVLLERGRASESVQEFRRALEILPDNPTVSYPTHIGLATAYERLNRLDEAAGIYRRILQAKPDDIAVLYGLAVLYRRQGRLEKAATYWRQVIQLKPNHAGSLSDLGTYHFLRGELGKARELWERAAVAEPTLPTVWYNLGLVFEKSGEHELAAKAWRRFLENARDDLAQERTEVSRKLQRASP